MKRLAQYSASMPHDIYGVAPRFDRRDAGHVAGRTTEPSGRLEPVIVEAPGKTNSLRSEVFADPSVPPPARRRDGERSMSTLNTITINPPRVSRASVGLVILTSVAAFA